MVSAKQKKVGVVLMKDKNILVVGGDLRLVYLADNFLKNGFDLRVYGMDYNTSGLGINPEDNLKKALDRADVVILPLPVSRDGIKLNAPFFKADIYISELLDGLKESHTVFAGMLSAEFKAALKEKNIKYFDYFADEVLTLKNAAITAEGAISVAIENTPLALSDSACLVLGYGRIGKFLAKYLSCMGAKVTIAARRQLALEEAHLSGYNVCHIEEIYDALNKSDVIFNTIPIVILNKAHLECIRKRALVIDLASKPGGVDLSAASSLGINHIQALSIPGKTAPESAGRAIYKTILKNFDCHGR